MLKQKGIIYMVVNRIGAQYHCKGITYTIGDKIIATGESAYEGLFGTIAEIRDGDDLETGIDGPDIYCEFIPPVFPEEVKALEERFSKLYGKVKKLEDITLDMVIMAPEMLCVMEPVSSTQDLIIFIVREEWAFDGDYGASTYLATSPIQAKRIFTELIFQEQLDGCIRDWTGRQDMELCCKDQQYECWLHDEYYENHYKVCIEQQKLSMDTDAFAAIGRRYVDGQLRKHFAEQIQDWEEIEDVPQPQLAEMIASPAVPEHIRRQLGQNGFLVDAYWESVSEASYALVKNYLEGLK